jgi:type II secretory pathway pseudopilin PulG
MSLPLPTSRTPRLHGNSVTAHVVSAKSGYLLLEVLLAIAILIMVAAVVFEIIQTSLKASTQVTFIQGMQEKMDGISELLRQNFAAMPQVTLFQTRQAKGATELIFKKAPFTFSLDSTGKQFGTVIIAGQPESNGRYSLNVLQEPETATDQEVDSAAQDPKHWTPLVSDLTRNGWIIGTTTLVNQCWLN